MLKNPAFYLDKQKRFIPKKICGMLVTLYFYNNEPSKNKHFLILLSKNVRDIFCRCHLHNASKEVFQPKIFLNCKHGFKSTMKDFFWSIMKMTSTKNIPNMSQGLPNPGFRSARVEILRFSQKGLKRFQKFFLILVPVKYLARLDSKIRKYLFFDGSLL